MSAAAPYQRLTAKAPHPPSSSPLVLQQFHGCQGHAIPDADPITASSVAIKRQLTRLPREALVDLLARWWDLPPQTQLPTPRPSKPSRPTSARSVGQYRLRSRQINPTDVVAGNIAVDNARTAQWPVDPPDRLASAPEEQPTLRRSKRRQSSSGPYLPSSSPNQPEPIFPDKQVPQGTSWQPTWATLQRAHKVARNYFARQLCTRLFPDGFTHLQVAELSLTMMATLEHQHRCWKLYKLAYADDDPRRPPVDPATFKARLVELITPIFPCHIHTIFYEGATWIRVAIYSDTPLNAVPSFKWTPYLVYSPWSSFIAITFCRAEVMRCLKQCLEAIFGCMDLVEQPLLGKNVMDLQRLFATQPSQEHYAAFRVVEQIAHDPLAHSSTQGPILPSLPAPDAARHPNTQLVRQDQAIIDRQRVQAFRQFGPECPNVFKRIEIQHTAPWSPNLDHLLVNRAESHKDLDFSLSMTVTIQGSSVMQGLKALTERGMVNGVLPDFLTQLPSKGTNHTVVERGL